MKTLYVLLLTILLSSCVTTRYGNFTKSSEGKDIYLAKDAVSQLTKLYPPAHNTFCISQKVCDGFGMNLIEEMRKKGYGVVEQIKPKQKGNFFYVLDETEPHHIYRLSLYIHSQSLSRMYARTNGKLSPISPWSYKE